MIDEHNDIIITTYYGFQDENIKTRTLQGTLFNIKLNELLGKNKKCTLYLLLFCNKRTNN